MVIRTIVATLCILLWVNCEGDHFTNQQCVNEDTRLLGTWFGSLGWGASAGNGGGVGRVYSYWSYRWQADRSGKIVRIRFNLPRRTGYFGGSGGTLRLTVRKNDNTTDWPDLNLSGILWKSEQFVFSSSDDKLNKHDGLTYVAGFGGDEIVDLNVGPLNVKAGEIYHFVWTNEHSDVKNNWYSVNNAFNQSLPNEPYQPYKPYAKFNTLTSETSGKFNIRYKWIPYLLIKYADNVWVGQS